MKYIYYNPNPKGAMTGDCVIRAVSKVTGRSWDETYLILASYGFDQKKLSNTDSVWGSYLKDSGFTRETVPNTCPNCYTVRDFCRNHPHGVYILGTGTHVVAVIDGNYYDSWDSGKEVPIYYWRKDGLL